MKLSSSLLHAISLGIAVSALSSSCQQNEVNSGTANHEKKNTSVTKEKKGRSARSNCPACGMG